MKDIKYINLYYLLEKKKINLINCYGVQLSDTKNGNNITYTVYKFFYILINLFKIA